MNTIPALFALRFPHMNSIIIEYAEKWGARVQIASTPDNDEHIVAVLHDDHVFAAASSKASQTDALVRLADRILAKAV